MTSTTLAPAALVDTTSPRPGQTEIDPAAPCAAPACGIPAIEHTGTPYTVDGFPVGSAGCADTLYRWRRAIPVIVATRCNDCGVTLTNTRAPLARRCYWCATGTTPEQLAAESGRYALTGGAL